MLRKQVDLIFSLKICLPILCNEIRHNLLPQVYCVSIVKTHFTQAVAYILNLKEKKGKKTTTVFLEKLPDLFNIASGLYSISSIRNYQSEFKSNKMKSEMHTVFINL
uniref:Uncharacterized protein n=1 Tax=Micrurus carvalhoi TaxID=3147026 RepID=A0A2H6N7Y8_9SAUR